MTINITTIVVIIICLFVFRAVVRRLLTDVPNIMGKGLDQLDNIVSVNCLEVEYNSTERAERAIAELKKLGDKTASQLYAERYNK